MLILDLWGISFHAVVVFALGKNLLFKFALGHCVFLLVRSSRFYLITSGLHWSKIQFKSGFTIKFVLDKIRITFQKK